MTEIYFFRNNKKKKQIKLVGYHIFLRLTFWCIGKLDVHQMYPLSQLLFIYIGLGGIAYFFNDLLRTPLFGRIMYQDK